MAINQPSFQQIQQQPGGQTPSGVQNALNSMQAQQQNRIAMYAPIAQQLGPVGLAALAQVDPGARLAMNDLGLGASERYLDDYTKGVIAHATGDMSDDDFFSMQQQSPSRPFSNQQEQNLRMLFARIRPKTQVEGGGTTEVTEQNQYDLNLGQGGSGPPPPVTPDPVINEVPEFTPTEGGQFTLGPQPAPKPQIAETVPGRPDVGVPINIGPNSGKNLFNDVIAEAERRGGLTPENIEAAMNTFAGGDRRLMKTDSEGNATIPMTPEEVMRLAVDGTTSAAPIGTGEQQSTAQRVATAAQLYEQQLIPQLVEVDARIQSGDLTREEGLQLKAGIRQRFDTFLQQNGSSFPDVQQALERNRNEIPAYEETFRSLFAPPQAGGPQSSAPTQGTLRDQVSQSRPVQGTAPQLGQQLTPGEQTTDRMTPQSTPEQAEESRIITEQEALAHLEATGNPAMVKQRTGEQPATFGIVNTETGEVNEIPLTTSESRNFAESITALHDPNTSPTAREFHRNRLSNLTGRYGDQVIQETRTVLRENPEVRRTVIESTDAVLNQWNQMIKDDPQTMFQFLPETVAARQGFRTQEISNANTEAQTNRILAETKQLERINEQFDWVREELGDEAFKAMQVEQFQLELERMRSENMITKVEADFAEKAAQARLNYTRAQTAAMLSAGSGVQMDGASQMLGVLTTMMESPFVEGNEEMQAQLTEIMFGLSGLNVSIERNPFLRRLFGPEWDINIGPLSTSTTGAQEETSRSTSDSFINAVE